jgi:galactonate dehydratase
LKITDLDVMVVKVPTAAPKPGVTARGLDLQRTWVLVKITTDVGITGIGDSSQPAGGGSAITSGILKVLRESLIGEDPNNIEMIWQRIYRRFTYAGSRGPITRAISGIDMALWDIKGKALGRPVYDLLGGPVRDSVSLYTHPRTGSADELTESARQLVAQGFTALKTDPFWEETAHRSTAYMNGQASVAGIERGGELIAALREAVGPNIEILIDAHANFNVASAIRAANRLEEYDITWFEEPVQPESIQALQQVKENVRVPICVGERLFTRFDFAPVLENRLAEYIMPDICWTGGISEMKKIAIMAEAYYVPISPHNVQSPIQIVAGGHTMLTVPNFYRLEIASLQMELYAQAFDRPLDIRNGELYVSDRPGLGIELNMDYIEKNSITE